MNKTILSLFLVVLVTIPLINLYSIEPDYSKHPAIKFLKKEKLQNRLENVLQNLENNQDKQPKTSKKPNQILSGESDKLVFPSNFPESEMHAAINPKDSNNIVVSPIRFNISSNPVTICPVYFTKDFGKTWKKSSFSTLPPLAIDEYYIMGGGDPVFAFDANGVLYFTWINLYLDKDFENLYFATYYAYSENGGEDWEYDGKTIGKIAQGNGFSFDEPAFDKQWMCSDLSNTPYRGSVYISLTAIEDNINTKIYVFRKKPGNKYFETKPVYIEDDFDMVQFSSIDVDAKGLVHLSYFGLSDLVWDNASQEWVSNQMGLYHCTSKDGGESFSAPKLVTIFYGSYKFNSNFEIIPGLDEDRIYPSCYLAADKYDSPFQNNVYITFTSTGINKSNLNTHHNIYLTRSTDSGLSWETPRIINSDYYNNIKNHNFYSNIYVNPDGKILVGWYDRRHSNRNHTHYYLGVSDNGGLSFDFQQPVTSQDTDFETVGLRNGLFGIGEYNQIVSTSSTAFVFWADGRTNDGNMNVYVAKVNLDETVSVGETKALNAKFQLLDAYPNPLQNYFNLKFNCELDTYIDVSIYDIQGMEIFSKGYGMFETGEHEITIDMSSTSSAIYYYKLKTDFGYYINKITVQK